MHDATYRVLNRVPSAWQRPPTPDSAAVWYLIDKYIEAVEKKLSVASQVCAEVYQIAGQLGAHETVLDNLLAVSNSEATVPHDTLLPYNHNSDYTKDSMMLPCWAVGASNGNFMEIGAVLPTRDGRRHGSSVVFSIAISEFTEGVIAKVVTDSGNTMTMTRNELEASFYPPEFIMGRPGILDRIRLGCEKPEQATQNTQG